jgi:hypothetical protein
LGLFGKDSSFSSISKAISYVKEKEISIKECRFERYEISILFSNDDRIEASFKERKEAINFLNLFK